MESTLDIAVAEPRTMDVSASPPSEPNSEGSTAPELFLPSAEWIAAFERQYEAAMMALVGGERRRGAGFNQRAKPSRMYAQDDVQDAAADTLEGRVRWDPGTKALEQHLREVLNRRANVAWRRGKKFPHHSLDAAADGDATDLMREVGNARGDPRSDPSERIAAAEHAAALYEQTRDDPELTRFLKLRAEEMSRADIMALMKLSIPRYRSLCRRLDRAAAQTSITARPRRRHPGDNHE